METIIEENKIVTGAHCHSSFCWKAVLAGVVTALSVQIALTVLGLGLGMASVNPMTQYNPFAGLSKFGAYWWILSGLVSLGIGSFVAGHFSKTYIKHDGDGVGLVTWSVINVLGALAVLCTAGTAIEGGGRLLGGTFATVIRAGSNVAPNVAEQVKNLLPDDLKEINTNQARSELDLLIKGNSQSDQGLSEAFDRVFNRSGGFVDPANKEALANVISSRSNVSQADALAAINRWQASYDEVKARFEKAKTEAEQKVRAAGEKAAKAAAVGSIVVFFTLMLGLATSIIAARLGIHYRHPDNKICWR